MKIIDKNGKLFSKIHIFDLILIILVVVVALTAISKSSDGAIISFKDTSEVKMEYTLETYAYKEEYFSNLKVGDQLAEDKKYLDGEITNIEIIDVYMSQPDNNGDVVTAVNPLAKQAVITVVATVEYNNPIYAIGKQELRQGAPVYLTTETSKLSTIVTGMKVIE